MKRLSAPVAALALAACAAALPSHAALTASLTARESVNYLYYFGGFAISGDEGEAGAPAPVAGGAWEGTLLTGFEQPDLAISGSDYHVIEYLFWGGYLAETWDQSQSFSAQQLGADAVLHIEGHATISQTSEVCSATTGCNLASELHRSTNTLLLEFTVDASTPYLLEGLTSGGQYVELSQWNVAAQRWFSVIGTGGLTTIDRSFSLAGNLPAGLYRFQTDPYTFSGGRDDVVNSFTATLTLQGATLAPVPEPPAGLMAALGLAAVALRLHRRRTR